MPQSSDEPYRNPALSIEQRVEDLLGRMSLQEKVAQMSIYHMTTNVLPDEDLELDETTRRNLANGVGGLGRPGQNIGPRATAQATNAVQKFLKEHTRLGIPAFFIDEALHGLMAFGSTMFPQAIGLASTWDPALVQQVFEAAAREMRSRGENWALTPVLDLAREPRWGRTEETYGEDPYLGSRIGVAAIRGLQGVSLADDLRPISREHVLATAKHFAAHGHPEGGRNCAPANISEVELRESYLEAFQAAVQEAGVGSVMASYNEINGVPAHINRWLLDKVLRQDWGFAGILVSDGYGITRLESAHHVAASQAEAARKTLSVGMDFELDNAYANTLLGQVEAGTVPEEQINLAVRRVLTFKFLLGLFDDRFADPAEAEQVCNSPAHRELAYKAASESLILLKNDGLCPLDRKKVKTLAVIGPNAAGIHLGGYSAEPGHAVSILDGVRERAGEEINVVYAPGCRITEEDFEGRGWRGWHEDPAELPDPEAEDILISEAVEIAMKADVVLLVLGENESVSREAWGDAHLGDRDSLDLPGKQKELVEALVKTGVPLAALLINGRPLSVNLLAEQANTLFEGWYLGQEGGAVFADALFGQVNPGGKLPISIPRSVGQLPAYYNRKPSADRAYLWAENSPLYPFGHGLSYTEFRYENLRVEPAFIHPHEKSILRVDVSNTGLLAGDEVVQFYIRDLYTEAVTRPIMELKGFQRITLQPGQTRTVEFAVGFEQLAFFNENVERVVEPGEFELMLGGSSAKVQKVKLEVTK